MKLFEVPNGNIVNIDDAPFITVNGGNLLNPTTWEITNVFGETEVELVGPLQIQIPKRYHLSVDYDHDADNPSTADTEVWTIFPFDSRFNDHKDREDFLNDKGQLRPDLAEKIKTGFAFPIAYSEHGPHCNWNITSDWDSCDGVAIWELTENLLPDTIEKRRESCEDNLQTYTDWCNGSVFSYEISSYGQDIAYGTVYGSSGIDEIIREDLPEYATKANTSIYDPHKILNLKEIFRTPNENKVHASR